MKKFFDRVKTAIGDKFGCLPFPIQSAVRKMSRVVWHIVTLPFRIVWCVVEFICFAIHDFFSPFTWVGFIAKVSTGLAVLGFIALMCFGVYEGSKQSAIRDEIEKAEKQRRVQCENEMLKFAKAMNGRMDTNPSEPLPFKDYQKDTYEQLMEIRKTVEAIYTAWEAMSNRVQYVYKYKEVEAEKGK